MELISRNAAQRHLLKLGFQANPGHRGELSRRFILCFYETVIVGSLTGELVIRYRPKADFESRVHHSKQDLGLE